MSTLNEKLIARLGELYVAAQEGRHPPDIGQVLMMAAETIESLIGENKKLWEFVPQRRAKTQHKEGPE